MQCELHHGLDGDGVVAIGDVLDMLGMFGESCP